MIHFHKDAGLAVYLTMRSEQSSGAFYAGKVQLHMPAFLKNSDTLPYAGWDMEESGDREAGLVGRICHDSAFYASAYHERRPLAFAWGVGIGAGSVQLHFIAARRDPERILKAGRYLLRELYGYYPGMIALVPEPFQGAHRLARRLGFREKGRLPKACRLAARGKFVDGRLYLWEG